MIEIVDHLERAAEADRLAKEQERRDLRRKNAFRNAVYEGLEEISDGCVGLEQTTHASLFGADGPSIRTVAERLVRAYEEPSAYNISNLTQAIDAFCKVAPAPSPSTTGAGDVG